MVDKFNALKYSLAYQVWFFDFLSDLFPVKVNNVNTLNSFHEQKKSKKKNFLSFHLILHVVYKICKMVITI